MAKEETYLFCHTDKNGKNAAQAEIPAKSANEAYLQFKELYPEREVTGRGVLGKA